MARHKKIGLDYFSLDTDISNDPKVELLEAAYGLTGFAVYIKLLTRIYNEKGYYYKLDDKQLLLLSNKLSIEKNQLQEIINFCVDPDVNLFDADIYSKHFVLTSASIQKRYLMGCKRREIVHLINEYLLTTITKELQTSDLTIIESIKGDIVGTYGINANINDINVNIGTESKTNKKKRNKRESKTEKIHTEIIRQWNIFAIVNKLIEVKSITTERRINLDTRLKEDNFNIEKILLEVKKSDWLLGKLDTSDFKITFDWIIKNDDNYIKVLEGKYRNKNLDENQKPVLPKFDPGKYADANFLKAVGSKIKINGADAVDVLENLKPAEKGEFNNLIDALAKKNKITFSSNEKYQLKIYTIGGLIK